MTRDLPIEYHLLQQSIIAVLVKGKSVYFLYKCFLLIQIKFGDSLGRAQDRLPLFNFFLFQSVQSFVSTSFLIPPNVLVRAPALAIHFCSLQIFHAALGAMCVKRRKFTLQIIVKSSSHATQLSSPCPSALPALRRARDEN